MKNFRKLLYAVVILLMVGSTISSCTKYDDTKLWEEVNGIKSKIAMLNSSVSSLQTVVNALQNGKIITEVTKTDTGHTIKFNDGKSIEILNGKDAPVIGIKEVEGVYYWTITTGSTTDFLYDSSDATKKLPVTGKDGATPTVDGSGYWVINGKRLLDANNKEVKAVGKDGDSFFKGIKNNETEVIFTLANGTTLTVPKVNNLFSFLLPEGETGALFAFGETKKVTLNITNMTTVEILRMPGGWAANLDITKKTLEVTAPSAGNGTYNEGIISLIGLDKKGNTLLASLNVYAVDFTDKDGTFIVCEGNMSTVNGTVTYYAKNGKEFKRIFENANNGLPIGSVCQDMYIANDRIYLISQNGGNMGGAGRFIVYDAKTLKMIYSDPLEIKTPDNKATWPQHLVVTGNSAYIQYSEAGMESRSGICRLTLSDKSVQIDATIDGTFGAFTIDGATKNRMLFSRGKIYAGAGQKVVIINPTTNSVEKTIPFAGRQVKGIVKAADNNIYIALAGTYTGSNPNTGKLSSDPKIVAIDHSGNIISETELVGVKLPIATWSPGIGMCASFTDSYIYFVDTDAFNATTASRYNYITKKLDTKYVSGDKTIYGIMGQHPTTKKLWVGKSSYIDTNIYVYDVTGATATQENQFYYESQNEASPAGIDFTYRFTSEYLNR